MKTIPEFNVFNTKDSCRNEKNKKITIKAIESATKPVMDSRKNKKTINQKAAANWMFFEIFPAEELMAA